MAELINLNKARKDKAKQSKRSQAAENRIVYGISTQIRKREKAAQTREAAKLDGNRLETDSDNKKG